MRRLTSTAICRNVAYCCCALVHTNYLYMHMPRWIHAHAGLTLVNMLWFWYVAMGYRYKDVKHAQKRYVGGTSLKPPRGPVPPWARAREVSIPIGHRRPVTFWPPSHGICVAVSSKIGTRTCSITRASP